MIKKISLLFILFLPIVLGQQITLNDLNVDISNEWCFDELNNVTITPLDLNNNITYLTSINYSLNNEFLHSPGAYEKDDVYYLHFFMNSTSVNKTQQNIILNISAIQHYKVIEYSYNITISDCTNYKTKFKSFLDSSEIFFNKYQEYIIISITVLYIIIVLFLILKIIT